MTAETEIQNLISSTASALISDRIKQELAESA